MLNERSTEPGRGLTPHKCLHWGVVKQTGVPPTKGTVYPPSTFYLPIGRKIPISSTTHHTHTHYTTTTTIEELDPPINCHYSHDSTGHYRPALGASSWAQSLPNVTSLCHALPSPIRPTPSTSPQEGCRPPGPTRPSPTPPSPSYSRPHESEARRAFPPHELSTNKPFQYRCRTPPRSGPKSPLPTDGLLAPPAPRQWVSGAPSGRSGPER